MDQNNHVDLKRREFLAAAAASVLKGAGGRTIKAGGWRLKLDAAGNIVSLGKGTLELVQEQRRLNRPKVVGNATLDCETDVVDLGGGAVAVKQTVTVNAKPGLRERVAVEAPRAIRLPFENRTAFMPLFNGVGRRESAAALNAAYVLSGKNGLDAPRRLALPAVSESGGRSKLRATYCTDAQFSSTFGDSIGWVYGGDVPAPEKDRRTIFTILYEGDEDAALRYFFKAAVSSVRQGPDWLHEIAAVDYDYLSKGGRGWFRDIDVSSR